MIAVALIASGAGLIGCEGGGNQRASTQDSSATTPGNYGFTVTGTDAANPEITTATTVQVVVQ
jgi:hypothetical protein